MAKLSKDTVAKIKELLRESYKTQVQIAAEIGCTPHTIKNINRGYTYHDAGIDYPIRKENRKPKDIEVKALSAKKIRTINIQNELMHSLGKSMKQIAREYEVAYSTVTRINNGERNIDSNLQYPLRQTGINIRQHIRKDYMNGATIVDIQNKYSLSFEEVEKYLKG